MVFAVTGCKMDDLQDDVNDLKDKVSLIEQQVKLLNSNLAVISYILDPQNKTISKVETVEENGSATQHVITLSDGTKLTLTIGKPGTIDKPVITIGDDKQWYINGKATGLFAVGEDGKNGDGYPEFRVEKGNWQVRFGTGDWENVPGGEGIVGGEASLGDQFFESATVSADGKSFVVTLKDGTIQTLPIVDELVCVIDRTGLTLDDKDFLVIEKGERKELLVQIDGENPQVTYPEGWRATLKKLDVADAKGNNYQLLIFAPAVQSKTLSRAAADNTADVTVQVQKGTFWAVDKIKVKTPQEFNTNLEKYNAGQTITVGELKINSTTYGVAEEILTGGPITTGGVYFISANNITLTYNLGTAGVDNLIIIPTTEDITAINLTVSTQIYFSGTFACQNVVLNNVVGNYSLRVNDNTANVALDNCKINNLVMTKGFTQANTGITKMKHFEISNSDIKFENTGANLYMLTGLDCETLKYHNNLFYYSGIPSNGSICENLKLVQATTVKDLIVTSNTLIDVESATSSDVNKGLLALSGNITGAVTVNKNLYYYTFRRCATQFLRCGVSPDASVESVTDNYIFVQNDYDSKNTKNVFYGPIGSTPKQVFSGTDVDFFDTTNSAVFNKATGVFTPKPGYTTYGAQR